MKPATAQNRLHKAVIVAAQRALEDEEEIMRLRVEKAALVSLLKAALWYVERSQHITDLGTLKRDKDANEIRGFLRELGE